MTREEFEDALGEFWMLLRPRLALMGIFAMVVGVVVYLASLAAPDRFTAVATFAAPKHVDMLTWVTQGDEMREAMNRKFSLQSRYETPTMQLLKQRWESVVKVRKSREGLLTVAVTDGDPKFAASLANDIAMEAQSAILRRKLSDMARLLADRKFLLDQAREQEQRWQKALSQPAAAGLVDTLPALDRYALEGVARNQAETAALSQRTTLDEAGRAGFSLLNQEVVRLQSQLATLARDQHATSKAMSSEMLQAVDALQRHVYWQALVEIVGRDVVRLHDQALMDIPFEQAIVPDARSGPPRLGLALLSLIGAWLFAAAMLLGTAYMRKRYLVHRRGRMHT